MSRLMDDQQKLVNELGKLYENVKKEGLSRRTLEKKEQYDKARRSLWKQITLNR